MYNPIIFDLDGTLLNTLGDLADAGNYTLRKMGFPVHEEKEFRYFVGNGIPKLIERMLPGGASDEDCKRALEIFGEYYELHKTDRTAPYEGIAELLKSLNGEGIVCLCCTNKDHGFSEELLKRFFGDTIAEVVGAGEGYPTKPAPDGVLYLAEKYRIPDCRPLYVGDSNVDMQTAANAKLKVCGVLWGFRPREELERYNPDYLAENAEELKKIILGGR